VLNKVWLIIRSINDLFVTVWLCFVFAFGLTKAKKISGT